MKKLFLLLPIWLLSACSSTTVQLAPQSATAPADWQQRYQTLEKLQQWNLNGRLAILNDHEAYHMDLHWQQQGDVYQMGLSGPLGMGATRLSGDRSGVTMSDADQKPVYAQSPDQLLFEKTGYRVPIEGLFYWVRGIPDPRSGSTPSYDEQGRLHVLQQSNWRIRFKGYTRVGELELPAKIFIDGYQVRVRLVVDEWTLAANNTAQ